MSNLSDLLPAGAGAKVITATADGNLATGQTVALQSNGTVKAVGAIAEAVGTEANYTTNNTSYTQCLFDPDTGKTIIAYQDHTGSNDKGMVVVATPTAGGTISLGTPVEFSTTAGYIAMTYDTGQNKVLLAYRGASNHLRARVGTVSGTSISFGTELQVDAENSAHVALAYDPDLGSHLVVYDYNSASGKARVLTVSGTSVTSGSAVTFDSSQVSQCAVAYDESADAYLVAYRDQGNSSYGTAFVTTVSGTTPSFGSAVVFESANTIEMDATYDSSAQKVVINYRDLGNSNRPTAIVGTVSGTSVSFGTAVVVASVETTVYEAAYDSINKKVVVTYRDETAENGTYAAGTVSGTSISFATPGVFNSGVTTMSGIAFDTTLGKFVIAYNDYRGSSSNTPYGTAVTLQLASTNSSDFAGITNQAINNSASGEVVVEGGVITNGSLSLTVGATYYVQDDGSLQSDTVTVPYSLNSASYDDVSFDYSGQDGSGQQVLFKPDGTKMYILGSVNDSVFEYDLSSAFDLSTASYQRSKSVSSQDNFPVGLAFNSNGTKMFITGNTNDAVFQYSLSGAYDVSTASYDSVSFSVTSQDTAPYGLFFNNDGTKMFVVGDAGNDINEYALSSGFDISTASYTRNFSVASQETNPRHVSFNPDGTKMYVVGTQNDKIQVYSLTTGFDLSTASFLRAFAVNTEDTQPNGITFNANGTKVFLIGQSEDKVFQYTAGVGSVTSVTAGKAIANTTLLLKG